MRYLKLAVVALLVMATAQVRAQTFVGSFRVDQGPFWTTNPPVYSALEAAALLFGGAPTDYSTSTVDSNPTNIDHMGWYTTIFVGGGQKFAEGYHSDNGPAGYNTAGDSSAYCQDNAIGSGFTNYVFRNDATTVPEVSSAVTLLLGAGGTALLWVRRRRSA